MSGTSGAANSFGWFSYVRNPPFRQDLLLEMHYGTTKFVGRPCELDPRIDVAKLWWRLTGIAKEQLASVVTGDRIRRIHGEPVVLPAGAVMGACWNALMEEESKESIAELYMDALRELRELRSRTRDVEEPGETMPDGYRAAAQKGENLD